MPEIGYVNARVRAHKSRLFEREAYEKLMQAPSFDDALSILLKTHLKPDLEQGLYREKGIRGAEEGLKIHFVREMRLIYRWLDPPLNRLVEMVNGRWDIHNLKVILRGKHHGVSFEEIVESFIPAGVLSEALLEELARQTDIRHVIDLLATWQSPYARPLTEVFPRYHEEKKLWILELALDTFFYTRSLSELRKRDLNTQLVREILRREIDRINLMTALKAVKERLEPSEVAELYIPGGKFITYNFFLDLCKSEDPLEVVEKSKRTPYGSVLDEGYKDFLKTGFLSALERKLEDYSVKKAISLFLADPLSIAVVLAYIWAKYNEVVNLRIILRGKAVGMSDEVIRRSLIIV
jgi:V/A-type H+-transporting ATPase subunit C